ncbi:MAG: hypothetical protein ACK5Z5_03250 [Neisseriaceae bacterium]
MNNPTRINSKFHQPTGTDTNNPKRTIVIDNGLKWFSASGQRLTQSNGNGIHKFRDGAIYEGEYHGYKMHGKGKQTLANGDIFEGEFNRGNLANGKYTFKNNEIGILSYEGGFLDLRMHGKGKVTFANGVILEGEFNRGVLSNGKHIFNKQENVITYWDFVNYSPDTIITIVYANGSKYIGPVKQMLPDSQKGMLICNNDNEEEAQENVKNTIIYQGVFKDGKFVEGIALYRPINYRFEGNFINGMRSKGKLINNKDGTVIFTGTWQNDCKHFGKMMLPDIGKYKGKFENGQPNGHGRIGYINGDVYEGEFKDGKPNGHGKMLYFNDDKLFIGEFKDAKLNGIATKIDFQNETCLKGEFNNGELQINYEKIAVDVIISQELKKMESMIYNYDNHIIEIPEELSDPISYETLEENNSWCALPSGITSDESNMVYDIYTIDSLNALIEDSTSKVIPLKNPTTRLEFEEVQVLKGFSFLEWLMLAQLKREAKKIANFL